MNETPTTTSEQSRLAELRSYEILDTPAEPAYDDIVKLASEICETPIAMVNLIDAERQWCKAKIGIEGGEIPRAAAFCAHVVQQPDEIFTVENALEDQRFAANPFVQGAPHVRFYAGAPLVAENGEPLGALCVVDRTPRRLTEKQTLALRVLAQQVVAQLELRRTIRRMRESETRRETTEKSLRESERRYRQLFELSPGFINIHNLDGVIAAVNPAAAAALGYETSEIVGKSLADFLTDEARPFFGEYLRRLRETSFEEGVFRVLSKNGTRQTWQYRNRVCRADDTGAAYVIGCAQDITELEKVQDRLRDLTLTDDLTTLYNRRGFVAVANQALRYARRNGKNCLIVYADLDNLKTVNDRFGHAAGSQMIVDAATVFKSFFRNSDIAARLGGDEFVIFVQDASEASAPVIKERLHSAIETFNRETARPLPLSISFGFVRFDPHSGATIEELVAAADRLMYAEKQAKKNSPSEPARAED